MDRVLTPLIVAAFVLGLLLRLGGVLERSRWEHDEAITYLIASGTPYAAVERLQMEWERAATWKALLAPTGSARFSDIAAHVTASSTMHPPLYFWMLHHWLRAWGGEVHTSLALNVLLFAGTFGCLMWLARRSMVDPFWSGASVWLWSVSPATIGITLVGRQYELLTLLAVILVSLCVSGMSRGGACSWLRLAAVGLTAAAGMLTHYHFVLLVLAATPILLVQSHRASERPPWGVLGALALGCLALPVVHPDFYRPFLAQGARAGEGSAEAIVAHLVIFLQRLAGFCIPGGGGPLLAGAGGDALLRGCWLLATVLILGTLAWAARSMRESSGAVPPIRWQLASFLIWITVLQALVYALGLVPVHAVGGRYFAVAWPFVALGLAFMLQALGKRGRAIMAILLLVQLISGSASLVAWREEGAWTRPLRNVLTTAESVVLDNTSPGIFPRIVAELPDTTLILVGDQDELLAALRWLSGFPCARGPCLYLSALPYYHPNSLTKQVQVVAMLRQRFDVSELGRYPLADAGSPVSSAYLLMPRRPPGSPAP